MTHGGAGSTLGALAFGLPLLIVPQGADHFYNADRVVAAGAAVQLMPDRLTADSARDAVRMLLHDDTFRERSAPHQERVRRDARPTASRRDARTTHRARTRAARKLTPWRSLGRQTPVRQLPTRRASDVDGRTERPTRKRAWPPWLARASSPSTLYPRHRGRGRRPRHRRHRMAVRTQVSSCRRARGRRLVDGEPLTAARLVSGAAAAGAAAGLQSRSKLSPVVPRSRMSALRPRPDVHDVPRCSRASSMYRPVPVDGL